MFQEGVAVNSSHAAPVTRAQIRRLREIYRSSGWPCADMLEVELLAAGLLERCVGVDGRETLRLTDLGISALAQAHAGHQAARTPHESLVERVANQLSQSGRLAWRGLRLRVSLPRFMQGGCEPVETGPSPLPVDEAPTPWDVFRNDDSTSQTGERIWCMAIPDVFSIRRSSVEAYLEPVVHEIKVNRADLLGDLRKPAKRAAYLAMASACWYVLGEDAKGRPIAQPEEVPPECGVLQVSGDSLVVARNAPRRAVDRLPFHLWMALAQASSPAQSATDAQDQL